MKEKRKKKKKLWKIILVVLAVLIIGFLLWPEDDGYYDDSVYDNTEMGQALSGNGGANREELVSYFGSDVIRDHYVKLKGNGEDRVTVLVYMNGSDLESEASEATSDLSEMVAGAGVSDKVNILVQTMGTKKWSSKFGISSKKTERYRVDGTGLKLVDGSLSQLDCTQTSTLADFIKWGAQNYPADRYILIFWNHGGGAVYGFGNDEWVKDDYAALTIDEMQSAFKQAGVFFDFIGMDCCIMSSLEVCCAFYDFCDYTILSEDFESGLGWYYTDWVRALYNNTSISTVELGTKICDDMVNANVSNTQEGDNSILALVDESMVKLLYKSWTEFAYASETELTSKNFSREIKPKRGGRVLPKLAKAYGTEPSPSRFGLFDQLFGDEDDVTLQDYYEVDIMSAASSISGNGSSLLQTAIANTLVHVSYSSGDSHLTGLAVSLPYGDAEGYSSMRTIFGNIGLDAEYISWLERFVSMDNPDDYYDYDDFDDSWNGWDSYDYYDDEDEGSLWDIIFGDDYDDEYEDYDDGLSLWDILFGDDDDYGFDYMNYDDFSWN